MRVHLISVLFFGAVAYSHAQDIPDQCKPANVAGTVYVFTAESGTPSRAGTPVTGKAPKKGIQGSFTLPNDTETIGRLININPYRDKCSVSTSVQDYTETAVASFLGQLGGVANIPGASTPEPGAKTSEAPQKGTIDSHQTMLWNFTIHKQPRKVPSNSCVDAYVKGPHAEAENLKSARDSVNSALSDLYARQEAARMAFNQDVTNLTAKSTCKDIVRAAQALAFPSGTAPLTPGTLGQQIDQLAFQAQTLIGHLTDNTGACKQDLQPLIDQDSAFLQALVQGTSSVPPAVSKWRDQLRLLDSVTSNIRKARESIASVLHERKNFMIDTPVHGSQQAITVTMACTSNALPVISADSAGEPPPAHSGATNSTGSAATQTKSGTSNPIWIFHFGPGPRFVYAGGLVISPLAQQTFSTSTNPAGTTPPNVITQQQGLGTRILPMAMLHARYWDQLPPHGWEHWLPNYLSTGITAKPSDNNGTSIEYLFGLSWAFAGRQIFVTTGAYAGRQQRLGDALMPNQPTTLSADNLPITQSLIWKAGFAITWAPAGK